MLRFIDGCDHYATADITKKWTSNSGVSVINGRNGKGLGQISSTQNYGMTKTLDAQQTWIVGFAFYTDKFPQSYRIFRLMDESTTHFGLYVNATSGTLSAARDTTVLATSVNALSTKTWYYIECKVTIGDAGVGNYEVRVNGTSTGWLPSTAADTRNGGNATANVIAFNTLHASANLTNSVFDDIYIADGQAGINDFLGDVKVTTLLPTSDGNATTFTPSTGSDNYAMVDEANLDSDTTYNASSTADQIDTFGLTDSTATSILGVQEFIVARKDDAGARTIATVCRSNGTDNVGATESPGTTYVVYRTIREVDPNTSAAWTVNGLNSAEFGYKVVA